MKQNLLAWLTCLLCWTPLIQAAPVRSFRTAIEQQIQHDLPNAHIGIAVMDAKTGELIYQRNAYQAFTPASNMKLFTAAAALFSLGPTFRYQTKIKIDPIQLDHHTLKGNVYYRFSGDPTLSIATLQQLTRELHGFGIHHIQGNIVLDTHRFQAPWYAPGWPQDDLYWYYAPPISAIILNQNYVLVKLTTPQQTNQAVTIKAKSATSFFTWSNHVRTATLEDANHHCSLLIHITPHNHIDLSGCMPISRQGVLLKFAIKNPFWLARSIILKSLQQAHIKLDGAVVHGTTPVNIATIGKYHSPPLSRLILTLFKHSNNLYAESLLKTMGYRNEKQGSFQAGVNAVKKILSHKTDINFDHVKMFDGSGGSRYNLISPRQIVRLLQVVYHSSPINTVFIRALPDSGIDGTLAHRMHAFDLVQKIHAKTGSLKGVSTLSGYMRTRSKREFIFSIMIDHFTQHISEARALQTEICEVLQKL